MTSTADRSCGIDHVVVVVPARNEDRTIGACLTSIVRARAALTAGMSSSVFVVADCCDDDTVTIALDTLRNEPDDTVVVTAVSNAGAARALGTRRALTDLAVAMERVWVATTDADTVVPEDWLTDQLAVADDGFIAVAGIVELQPGTIEVSGLIEGFRRSYTQHADGTHPHVHGANLGFRADAYLAVGGWNPLAVGEDHDLWNRLRDHGPVTSRVALGVLTSARLVGRAPGGFAADLADLARMEPVA